MVSLFHPKKPRSNERALRARFDFVFFRPFRISLCLLLLMLISIGYHFYDPLFFLAFAIVDAFQKVQNTGLSMYIYNERKYANSRKKLLCVHVFSFMFTFLSRLRAYQFSFVLLRYQLLIYNANMFFHLRHLSFILDVACMYVYVCV